MNTSRIIAIPGSLRANSSSMAVLRFIQGLLEGVVQYEIFSGLGAIAHFDDSIDPPAEVKDFRSLIRAADGVLICSPEYAFGVPGTLKNAIDWTVSSGEFVGKPVALITAATNGVHAHASLLLTLGAISTVVPEGCALHLPFIRAKMDASWGAEG